MLHLLHLCRGLDQFVPFTFFLPAVVSLDDATADEISEQALDSIRLLPPQFAWPIVGHISDRDASSLLLHKGNEYLLERILLTLAGVDLRIELMQISTQDLCNLLCDGPDLKRNAIVVFKTAN